MVAQATWGAAVTRDGGETWRWMCAAALGVDPRFEDPTLAIGVEGRLLAGTLGGLFFSDPEACEWEPVAGPVGGRWIIDLIEDPNDPTSRLAVATDVGLGDQLFESRDEGQTWAPRGDAFGELLLAAGLIAPSDSSRLYLSADIPGLPADRQTMVLRSDDGGETRTRLPFVDLTGAERMLRIRAVDPLDPDVLYGVVVNFEAVMDPHRLVRSDDGGETFSTVLEVSQIGDVVISDDAQTVWTASREGGVFRSDDRGLTFTRIHPDLPVSCLVRDGGALLACTDDAVVGFALARSADEGVSWEPLLRLQDIDEMIPCPTCSDVGVVCPGWLPDVSFDLGFDAGLTLVVEPDGGVGLPRDAGLPFECGGPPPPPEPGCGCRIGAGPGAPAWVWLVAAIFCGGIRRRRRQPH